MKNQSAKSQRFPLKKILLQFAYQGVLVYFDLMWCVENIVDGGSKLVVIHRVQHRMGIVSSLPLGPIVQIFFPPWCN